MKSSEIAIATTFVGLAGFVGWLLTVKISQSLEKDVETPLNRPAPLTVDQSSERGTGIALTKSNGDSYLDALIGLPNERLVRFKTEKDYRDFLASLKGSDIRLLGSLDALRTVRLGFDDRDALDRFLGNHQNEANFLVSLPIPPNSGSIQPGAAGFYGNVLKWLGITEDNSTWGEGVKVAIVDSGISDHSALTKNIKHIDLTSGGASDPISGHGTGVAGLIGGQDNIAKGIAPSVNFIDVRVADSSGQSNSYLLAEGIIAAADAGAQLINISMGSYGDSLVVRDAVEYAQALGAALVVSSGNEGYKQPAWPANIPSVTAVGSVDANGDLIDFSNTGKNLDIVAPGLQVYTAWLDGKYVEFTGTSVSAPLVVGAAAAAMSEFNLSPQQAIDYVIDYANEGGYPGTDNSYGQGVLDVGRMMNSNERGIYDLATVSNYIDNNGDLLVTVQNQGTETFSNSQLVVTSEGYSTTLNIPTLTPDQIHTFTIPSNHDPTYGYYIESQATLNPAYPDREPTNDTKISEFIPNRE